MTGPEGQTPNPEDIDNSQSEPREDILGEPGTPERKEQLKSLNRLCSQISKKYQKELRERNLKGEFWLDVFDDLFNRYFDEAYDEFIKKHNLNGTREEVKQMAHQQLTPAAKAYYELRQDNLRYL